MMIAPLLFYPFSKTIWMAFDLIFRPVRAEELRSQLDQPSPRPPTVAAYTAPGSQQPRP